MAPCSICCAFRPSFQPYRPDGYWYEPSGGVRTTSLRKTPWPRPQRTNQKFTRNRALTTFLLSWSPLKGLRFRTNVGADFIFDNFNAFAPSCPR